MDNCSIPRVSVIIPVRNCRDFIHEAIVSVLTQSFSDLEVLVIDDGSDDYDYRLLEDVDRRLRVIRLEGGGVSQARNVGISQARGAYIAFLDADDAWFPGKLLAQINYFEEHPSVGVVFGGFLRWHANDSGAFDAASQLMSIVDPQVGSDRDRSGWLYARLLGGLLVGMNTAVVRREVLESVGGFNQAMRQGEDYDLWLKCSRITEMHALEVPVALYRIHGRSAMHRLSAENHLAGLLGAAVMRWGLSGPNGSGFDLDLFKRRLGRVEFDHAYSHFWHGSRSIARDSFLKAARMRHRPVRSLAYFVLSYFRGNMFRIKLQNGVE